jgi:NAD-specific glutamate dehydrogenase
MAENEPKGEMPEAEVQEMDAPVTSEEPFDKERAMATISKLREAEKQANNERVELEHLRQLEDARKKAELSETERLKAELAEREQKLKELTIKTQQQDIANKIGLPAIFATRIQGETPEEMEADARSMLEALPKQKAAPNAGATSPGENAVTGETEQQKRKRLFG